MNKEYAIAAKLSDLIYKAETGFNIELPFIDVKFNLRGKCAGQAVKRDNEYFIRINSDLLNGEGYDHILNNTLPHELAHIICFYLGIGKGHDKVWKDLCIALGGTGKRCHDLMVTPARVTQQYVYKATCGTVVKVGKIQHNRIQNGNKRYRVNSTGGFLIPELWQVA